MTLFGALILLAVGLCLVFLTVGILHIVGIILAVIAVIGLVFALVGSRSPRNPVP